MSEGHANKHIGRGMKPRGKKAVKPQKENKAMFEPSSIEGHAVPASEPGSEPETVVSTPGNLDPVSLQNLELKTVDDLEAALSESEDLESEIAAHAEKVANAIEDARAKMTDEERAKADAAATEILTRATGIGPQQDGTYAFRGVIPEGYLDPVTEMAKDRGISVEQWCNEFFFENLAAFFAPAGKR